MEQNDLLSQVAARLAADTATTPRRKAITSVTAPESALGCGCPVIPCWFVSIDEDGYFVSSHEGRRPSGP